MSRIEDGTRFVVCFKSLKHIESEQAEKERKKNKKGKLKLDVELECASAEASTPLTANKLQALPPARPAQSRPITTKRKMGLG